jgi:hypothetical protein
VTIKVWDEQGVKEYRRRLEEATFEEQEVEKMVAELREVIEKATRKKEVTVKGSKRTGRKNGWWGRECEQSKNEVVKALREWRRNRIDGSRFLEAKRRYRERCKEKKKQKREREEKEIKEIKTERGVWKYINRERKKKESVSEEITMQEWEENFMKVWNLPFADDMVIVAKSEREMKEMMRSLGKYVRKKKLEVNVEKSHGQGAGERGSGEGGQGSWMRLGNRREKVER